MNMPLVLRQLLLLLLFCAPVAAYAVRLEQPYSVDVPVANQGLTERQAAESAGLLLVLEKLSGQQLDGNAVIKRAAASAEKYLQRFSYIQDVSAAPPPATGSPVPGVVTDPSAPAAVPVVPSWKIRLTFLPDAIHRLLDEAGAGIWPLDRPLVMLLMANEQAALLPLPGTDGNDAVAPLQALGLARGIPLLVPVPAEQDLTVVAAVQGLDPGSLQAQMLAAKADALLLGNVRGSDDKGWSAQWLLQSRSEPQSLATPPATPAMPASNEQRFQSRGATLAALVDDALGQAAVILASSYRISASTDSGPAALRLQVEGVRSYAAFTRLRQYLEKLDAVQKIDSTQISGTTVIVDLDVKGRDSFRQLVSLFNALQWQEEITPPPGSDPSLRTVWRYQWQD